MATQDDIATWWDSVDAENKQMALRKRAMYGSKDLDLMGAAMDLLIPESPEDVDRDRLVILAAIGFYVQGKIARCFGSLEKGEMPTLDSFMDLEIYARMARRVYETGEW